MKKDIYLIKNDINEKVYIGQSVNAVNRFAQHKSEARLKSNQMLIHKAIRKYGEEHFELVILEKQIENFDERERFWIQFYNSLQPNGYNICIGGEGTGFGVFHPSAKIKNFEDLCHIFDLIKNSSLSFEEIGEKFGVSVTQVSNINRGINYKNADFVYPLRPNKKYSEDLIKQLSYSLKYELDKSLEKIAKEYNIDKGQLSEINNGHIYYKEWLDYPIRKSKEVKIQEILPNIIHDLQYTQITQKEIAKKYAISQMAVSKINLGDSWHNEQLSYPIRINGQNNKASTISPDLLKAIITDIETTTLSMSKIGLKYNINSRTICGINNGSIKKYRLEDKKYPLRNKINPCIDYSRIGK